MNSKRKAELQRKLTLASVPRPPADLAGRIKADIPNYLKATQDERERFSRSIAFNFRVAASILLLFSSLFVCIHLLTREPNAPAPALFAERSVNRVAQPKAAAAPVPTEDVRVEIAQEPPPALVPAPASAIAPAPAAPRVQIATAEPLHEFSRPRERDERRADDLEMKFDAVQETKALDSGRWSAGGVVGGVVGGTAGGVVAPPESITAVAEAPMVTAAPPPSPYPAAPAPLAVEVPAPPPMDFVSAAYGSSLDLGPRATVFGITIDPQQFHRLKSIIESGDRPKADSVNVEALVNYFAGTSPKRTRGDVRLDVEASPAPVGVDGHRGIIRFTIDTASVAVLPGSTNPPAATNASIAVEMDENAVTDFRAIGDGNGVLLSESVLQKNMSVTGLYELTLRSDLSARQRVATVTLSYHSISSGRDEKITRALYGKDFTHKWTAATRRHRLASLGAVWGETLKGTAGGTDVAQRAEELAKETKDERAKELAQLATASSRIRTSTPTGSGRL